MNSYKGPLGFPLWTGTETQEESYQEDEDPILQKH